MEIKQISDKDYFALEAFSNSGGGKLSPSYTPKHFKANTFSGSSATRTGTAVHARILNDVWFDEIKVFNGTKTLTSKAAIEYVKDHPDFTVITQEESDAAKLIVDAQDGEILKFFNRKCKNEIAMMAEL